MTTPGRSFVTIESCRIECEWHPAFADSATLVSGTIVFLHEGLGSISQWGDFPAALCARTGCAGLVYNRCGYGGSGPLEPPLSPRFLHREALEVLPRLLEAFDIRRPVLLGHSDGGSIALIYAGSGLVAPDALVLEAPHVFVEEITVTQIARIRASYSSSQLRARLARHHGDNVDRLFNRWTDVWLSDEFRPWNLEAYLSKISCETLVIQGKDDEYGTARQVSAIQTGIGRRAHALLLDNCRHAPHVDRRATVEDAVVSFVERARSRRQR